MIFDYFSLSCCVIIGARSEKISRQIKMAIEVTEIVLTENSALEQEEEEEEAEESDKMEPPKT